MWYSLCNRLVIPIRNYLGGRIGHTLRKLASNVPGSKSIIITDPGCEHFPSMAWYPMMVGISGKVPVLLVEDQLSAMKASSYLDSVALLGTNLSEDKISELLKAGVRHVVLALDKDATAKASLMVRKYKPLFQSFTMLPLEKDLKDMSYSELDKLLGHLL